MSTPKEQKPEDKKGRVAVGNLPQQETELKDREAESIKGGGGVPGGVLLGRAPGAGGEVRAPHARGRERIRFDSRARARRTRSSHRVPRPAAAGRARGGRRAPRARSA